MTISMDKEVAIVRKALIDMLQQVGDNDIRGQIFTASEKDWAHIPHTTWLDMKDQGYLLPTGAGRFRLAGFGWYKGLKLSGGLEDPGVLKRIDTLQAALKDRVKDRQKAFVLIHDIARETGLPVGWIFNAIDSHVICRLRDVVDAEWAGGHLIEIPERFGKRLLTGAAFA